MIDYKSKHCSLQYPLSLSLPETISFILLNVRALKRHAIDIDYDRVLIENDTFFSQKRKPVKRRFKCQAEYF